MANPLGTGRAPTDVSPRWGLRHPPPERKPPVAEGSGAVTESSPNEDAEIPGAAGGGGGLLPLHVTCGEP